MKNAVGEEVPNPGSDAARERGCICPVLDNRHGTEPPIVLVSGLLEGWYTRPDCPVHSFMADGDE